MRWRAVSRGQAPLADVLQFMDHCQQLGAGGLQVVIPADAPFGRRLREKAEASGLFLEGQVQLPASESDLARFEDRVRAAKEAGVSVLRTACLSGRRYETFLTGDAFKQFARQSEKSLALAEPVVRRHQLRLAVENHKDWRIPEMLRLLGLISSPHVGVCVDTGNSIALLEEPLEVIRAYAPYAISTHLKDMAVREYEQGFLLAEVPLGEGYLDLRQVVGILRAANPDLQFCLEMITRDALKVPCLTKNYWATMEDVTGWALAATLADVRKHQRPQPIPQISHLSQEEKFAQENEAVRQSLAYARQELAL
jgi:sugar phosphate isomerase/epimerase